MNWRRFFAAVVFAFTAAVVLDILLNGVLLRNVWRASAHGWRSPAEMNRLVPLGWISILLVIIFQSAIFVRAKWQGIGRGLEFGGWLALASFIGVVGGMASVVSWPLTLILAMAAQQVMNNLITGFSLGWLYRTPGH